MQKTKYHLTEINFTIYYIFIAGFLSSGLSAQNIPATRRVEWNIAGIQGGIPCRGDIYNFITVFGGDNTGVTDNSVKLNNALTNTPAGAVIFFPNGTYRFTNTINVPSDRVIRGQSVSGTTFNFILSGGKKCFNIKGSRLNISASVTTALAKGGNTLILNNASAFNVGDDILMEQENGAIANDPATWADNLRGQLFVITAKSGNTVTLDRTFTLDYNPSPDVITVHKLNLVKHAGFESFTIDRQDAASGTNNETFLFEYTANCWMKCIRSLRTGRYHVYLDNTRNAEIRGCYFYEEKDYGGGGNGYGVLCQDHVGECLIENNVFRKLRHALIAKEGAGRNVYGYNYSLEATWTLAGIPADLSLHGHYAYYNLFESNIVQRVTITDAWGRAGPGNTLFRNRIEGPTNVRLQNDSDNQNLEGNELIGTTIIDFNYDGTINGTIRAANRNANGNLEAGTPASVPNSYYHSFKPSFFGALPWPAIGPGTTFNNFTIPAKKRFENYTVSGNIQDVMDHCATCSVLPVRILNFYLYPEENTVRLHWQAQNDFNVANYEIEKSYDGLSFQTIAVVTANKNSGVINYSYDDYLTGESSSVCYRIVQSDVNGEKHYSKILWAQECGSAIKVHPNPFQQECSVFLTEPLKSDAVAYINDISGRTVRITTLDEGISSFKIDPLPNPGIYILQIKGKHINHSLKLIQY
ncbi:MAG: glycosyl hydrolase family 28-related protein [Cytophagaceae bacterium]